MSTLPERLAQGWKISYCKGGGIKAERGSRALWGMTWAEIAPRIAKVDKEEAMLEIGFLPIDTEPKAPISNRFG